MEKMYRVYARLDYDGYKNVPFTFFCHKHAQPLNFKELITDYNGPGYGETYDYRLTVVEECFLESEIPAVREFLAADSVDFRVEELPLPYAEKNTMGVSAIPVGGHNDFLMLNKREGYSLPFEIWAYYDVRGSDDYRHERDLPKHSPSVWIIPNDEQLLARLAEAKSTDEVREVLGGKDN
jgi:hypothetical protein